MRLHNNFFTHTQFSVCNLVGTSCMDVITYSFPYVVNLTNDTGREVPEPAVRRLQTRRMPLWNAWDCFITENLVLPVMYDSVHSVLVKQHGYIQWTNCTKNTLLGS